MWNMNCLIINTKSRRAILKTDKITALICHGVAKNKNIYYSECLDSVLDCLSSWIQNKIEVFKIALKSSRFFSRAVVELNADRHAAQYHNMHTHPREVPQNSHFYLELWWNQTVSISDSQQLMRYGTRLLVCLPHCWIEVDADPEGPATGHVDTGSVGFPLSSSEFWDGFYVPSCYSLLLMQTSRFILIKIKPFALEVPELPNYSTD